MKNHYKIIKVRLKKILYNIPPFLEGNIMNSIHDAVFRCHQLVIQVYQFLRLFILFNKMSNL